MDNRAANKSHIPCQSWVGQNVWSTSSTQGPLLNTPCNSQHLNLSQSSGQSSFYSHQQVSNQSCMSDLSTLLSENNTHHADPFKTSHIGSGPSSNALFTNTAVQNTSSIMSSSMLVTASKGKTVPSPSHLQKNQELHSQHLPFHSSHNPYKASFQPPVTNESLPHELQNLSTNLPLGEQCLSTSQGSFEGADMESTGFPRCTQRSASSSSQEQAQWASSSCNNEAVTRSVPDATAHPKNEQEGTVTPQADNEKRRSAILHRRAQLLKQLVEMDKLLETIPQDDNSDEHSPDHPIQSPSKDDSFLCEETETRDEQQVQSAEESLPAEDCLSSESCDEQEQETSDVPGDKSFSSESEDNASAESDNDSESDNGPVSNDDFPSDSDGHWSDDSSHSGCSTFRGETSSHSNKKQPKSGCSLPKDKNDTPVNETSESNQKPSKNIVWLTSESRDCGDRKKNYCLFCSRSVTKMARHLESIHSDKAEVAVAFQYPKKSKERNKIWSKLINEGNFAHNKEVLKTGKGQLAVRQRPQHASKATNFVHCPHCHGLYGKKFLFRHLTKCPDKKKNEKEKRIGRKSLALKCVLEVSGDLGISAGFKSILCGMIYDDVTQTIMNDKIILQFGEQMFSEYGSDVKKHGYIKQNIRALGRLVLEAAKTTPLKNLEEFFYLSSFRHVMSTVNLLTGYDSESKTYSVPSLALKLGYHLQKACSIVQDNAVKCGDDSLAQSAQKFRSMYQKKWNKQIYSGALTSLKETKLITEKNVPCVRDVKQLYFHIENVHLLAEKKLQQTPSVENYSNLAKAILARTVLFNRRKGQEVSAIQIAQFLSRKKSDVVDDMDTLVSDLERTMCGYFSRVDIRASSGRIVPVLLKPSFVSTLELLIDAREKCGVPNENPYLFGRPHALTAYRGAQNILKYVKDCGLKNHTALTLQKIQKHYGTMVQMMSLDDDEAYQILGPNNQVQALRQNSDLQLNDVEMISEGFQNRNKELSTNSNQYAQLQQAYGAKCQNKGSQIKDKHKWGEAEVRAVEKHMMRFIQGHKVPQKNDCLECLLAEADALKKRSWKGVKDYVRNRILALKRQGGSPIAVSTKRNRSRQMKLTNETQRTTGAQKAAPRRSVKSKEKGPKKKCKHKWEEAEVQAVERHMMRFVRGHKVPQKNDCLECLEAEPDALNRRTWKGVKDFVRNRIITLKRNGISPKAASANRPQQVKQRREMLRTTTARMSAPPKSAKSKEKGPQNKNKHKWGEEEVQAVERHMMRFIQGHKVPQKNDCLECLEAEPDALNTRTWKGVKDYIRNRITSLKRQSGASWSTYTNSYTPVEPHQSNVHFQQW